MFHQKLQLFKQQKRRAARRSNNAVILTSLDYGHAVEWIATPTSALEHPGGKKYKKI